MGINSELKKRLEALEQYCNSVQNQGPDDALSASLREFAEWMDNLSEEELLQFAGEMELSPEGVQRMKEVYRPGRRRAFAK